MNESAEEHALPVKRRLRWTLAYLCIVAGGILAAWQAHLHYFRTQTTPSRGGQYGRATRPAAPLPDFPELPPAEMIRDPLAAGGLKRLQGHPAGIGPPAGARRRAVFGRQDGTIVGWYEFPGDSAAADDHYTALLQARGFNVIDRSRGASRRKLLFNRDRTAVTVLLRRRRKNDKIVEIFLTVLEPLKE